MCTICQEMQTKVKNVKNDSDDRPTFDTESIPAESLMIAVSVLTLAMPSTSQSFTSLELFSSGVAVLQVDD